jgi:hypothetical protein
MVVLELGTISPTRLAPGRLGSGAVSQVAAVMLMVLHVVVMGIRDKPIKWVLIS